MLATKDGVSVYVEDDVTYSHSSKKTTDNSGRDVIVPIPSHSPSRNNNRGFFSAPAKLERDVFFSSKKNTSKKRERSGDISSPSLPNIKIVVVQPPSTTPQPSHHNKKSRQQYNTNTSHHNKMKRQRKNNTSPSSSDDDCEMHNINHVYHHHSSPFMSPETGGIWIPHYYPHHHHTIASTESPTRHPASSSSSSKPLFDVVPHNEGGEMKSFLFLLGKIGIAGFMLWITAAYFLGA